MTEFYTIIIIGLFLLFFLKKFTNLFDNQKDNPEISNKNLFYSKKITPDNFYLRPSLLFPNEKSFFEQLKLAVGNQYDIYPQVSLISIFQPTKKWHNRAEISKLHKTIDFVLFDKNAQTPKIAIELDGYSHSKPRSFDRDEFVNAIFSKFNIPLIRFNNGSYSVEEIRGKLAKQ